MRICSQATQVRGTRLRADPRRGALDIDRRRLETVRFRRWSQGINATLGIVGDEPDANTERVAVSTVPDPERV